MEMASVRIPKKFEFMALSAHMWLDELYTDANRVPPPHQLRDDLAKALRWLGLKNFSDIKQEHYELWSAGFVCYLAEGKAPSAGLKDQFKAFSQWAKEDPPRLVTLSDDIRGVFARLLSVGAEIAVQSHDPKGSGSLLATFVIALVVIFLAWFFGSR
jgi:hypothetical protein